MDKDSAHTKELPDGCVYCSKGSKMVLLVTGRCEAKCWYCPLSEEKKGKNVVFADEKKVDDEKEIIEEAKSIDAEGTGITGGDPIEFKRTPEYISMLKAEFGEEHHIHLYTQSTELDDIRACIEAGLDEIRFHPPPDIWKTIEQTEFPLIALDLKDQDIDVGIEIPSIPEMEAETYHMLRTFDGLVDFINLNELEFSSTNWEELVKRDYKKKSDISSAVKGSQEMAMRMLKSDIETPLHYCSSSFKDGVQLRNRIKRRAENVAKEGDLITEEGTLVRGIILSKEPKKRLEKLKKRFQIPDELIWFDEGNDRIEISLAVLEKICKKIEDECYGIEEYPTSDRLEVERWPLDSDEDHD